MSKVKRDERQRLQLASIQAVKFNHATCKKADTFASRKVYQNVVLSCVFFLDREKFQENWCPSFFPWILGISSSSHRSWSFQEAWTLWGYPASVGLPDQAPVFVDLPPGAEKLHHPTLCWGSEWWETGQLLPKSSCVRIPTAVPLHDCVREKDCGKVWSK